MHSRSRVYDPSPFHSFRHISQNTMASDGLVGSYESKIPPGEDKSGLPDGNWVGNHHLGDGGQGTVHCWVQVDSAQRIIDRLVIKDSWSLEGIHEPEIYRGIYDELVRKGMMLSDAIFGSASTRVPFYKEAYVQGLLTPHSRATQSDTVRLRGYRRGNEDDPSGTYGSVHWRLYMDHCYAGDLHHFINYYAVRSRPIPEPFIWWAMECLASALVQMETAARARSHARKEKDETIVMVDMKPLNIFLDAAGQGDRYPLYPRIKVGDDGSAHITYKDDPENKFNRLAIIWSPGYLAPELSRPYNPEDEEDEDEDEDEENPDDEEMTDSEICEDGAIHDGEPEQELTPLYSWTNVWQLGKTIESMMRIQTTKDRDWNDDTKDRDSQIKADPPHHDDDPDFLYSEDLIDIVWQCGRFDPKLRPTPSDLLYMIKSSSRSHIHQMDVWGSEAWVDEQYEDMGTLTEDHKNFMRKSIKERAAAGKLWFLNDFEDRNLATRYRELDLDMPKGCELEWRPNIFRNRIGQIFGAEDPDQEPESLGRSRNNKRPRSDEADRKKPRI
jgi:serine/threonine protein kinase